MLTLVGSDGERLLHETVWFVTVPVGPAVRVAFATHTITVRCVLVEAGATAFALHFAVSQEAARHSTRAP